MNPGRYGTASVRAASFRAAWHITRLSQYCICQVSKDRGANANGPRLAFRASSGACSRFYRVYRLYPGIYDAAPGVRAISAVCRKTSGNSVHPSARNVRNMAFLGRFKEGQNVNR